MFCSEFKESDVEWRHEVMYVVGGVCAERTESKFGFIYTVEPHYNEVLGTMKITLLYQVSHNIRVKKQRNIKSWD